MITVQSKTWVPNLRGAQVIEYLLHCDDAAYQRWWPGTHLHMRVTEGDPSGLGSIVSMDEMIGDRRLRMTGVVTEIVPGKKLVWQLGTVVRLPGRLVLELEDDADGVTITHTVEAGLAGAGRVFDPLIRLYVTPKFARALDAHVKTEFPKLGELLAASPATAA